ncbi:hypothetical protein PHJA_000177900 [Phtheirospermum japonicum]|uniref:TRF2/HOY1 PH-like domain-containing protein n=1 Tax=Phtheirospermum japonicum TaxID=374723 RepID=A0A830B8C0_9LAMI|nr:hypothetical protein PHJA_000177900 [Phtheirospermum japonicum]
MVITVLRVQITVLRVQIKALMIKNPTPKGLDFLQILTTRTKKDDSGSQSVPEKLKASNFPATFIKIGVWQRTTRHEGDLTAKLYYAKRKLVWEVLDGALKSKIEIQWSDIVAIRAITHDINEPGTLEIELNQPPLFYREINPQPRKHTLWQQASDFTGGQAPIWRRHYVRFPPGVLDKHYERLLQCDQRLFALSQKPFPSHESPYFDPNMFGLSGLSLITEMPFRHEAGISNNAQTGLLDDIENHLLGETSDVNVSYNANCSETNYHMSSDADDQVMQYARYINPMLDGHVYPDLMPPQQYKDDTIVVEQTLHDDSLPPFVFPDNRTNGNFF